MLMMFAGLVLKTSIVSVCTHHWTRLTEAGIALKEWYAIINAEHRRMPVQTQQQLMDSCLRHVILYKASGSRMVPKHHQFVHLTKSIVRSGNPRFHTTYEDESINRVLAKIGRAAHPLTFTETLFERLLALGLLNL